MLRLSRSDSKCISNKIFRTQLALVISLPRHCNTLQHIVGDVRDVESLKKASEGSNVKVILTNFWQHIMTAKACSLQISRVVHQTRWRRI
jgi:hypothetical protein